MEKVQVSVHRENHKYSIHVGCSIKDAISEKLSNSDISFFLIITDNNVFELYRDDIEYIFSRTDRPYKTIVLDAGEQTKDLQVYVRLIQECLLTGIDRSGAIVAFGGGVIGDIAGFAAAVIKRGIKLIQIPTTLLSQVDSSIGGKVGINWNGYKNQVGAFYHPHDVFIDTSYLKTLNKREYQSGLAEVIKYSLVCDADLYDYLMNKKHDILNRDEQVMIGIIQRCCYLKSKIVELDERDTGVRNILNFGHTIGHGLEFVMGPDKITHGEAVAIGMKIESDILLQEKMISKDVYLSIEKILTEFGYPSLLPDISAEQICQGITWDKKVEGDTIHLVVLEALGKAHTIPLRLKNLASYVTRIFQA